MFGEHWKAPKAEGSPGVEAVSNVPEHLRDASPGSPGKKAKASADGPATSDWTLPVVIGICTIVVLVFVIIGSGGVPAPTAPKAMLFVISGLKGTEFMDAVVDGPYAPNIRDLAASGSFAACLHADDGRCCRTQDGPHLGPEFTFGSAPGIASILTGVNADKHRVNNDTFYGMRNYVASSKSYPTILKLVKAKGLSTAVVGSKNMLSTLGKEGRCSEYGVIDFECGDDSISRCLARSTCNTDNRVALSPSFDISDQAPSREISEDYSLGSEFTQTDYGKIFELTNDAVQFINGGADLIVIHINALELASNNAADGGDYTVQSKLAMSTLYMIDAFIGQMKSVVAKRVSQSRENWLVLGVSDHGGYNSTFGKTVDEDELIAFFGSTYTLAGKLQLQAPFPPVRQYDVAPTILRWFNLDKPQYMDGQSQMICSNGIDVANCTTEQSVMGLN